MMGAPSMSRRALLAGTAGAALGTTLTGSSRAADPEGVQTRFLFSAVADLEAPQDVGDRQIYIVTGGTFEGPRLRGEVLSGGGDWLVRRGDITTLDVRASLKTDDGAIIYTHYLGRVRQTDAGLYFRTTPYFETRSEKYDWLNGIVAIGVNQPTETGKVAYRVYEVL